MRPGENPVQKHILWDTQHKNYKGCLCVLSIRLLSPLNTISKIPLFTDSKNEELINEGRVFFLIIDNLNFALSCSIESSLRSLSTL